MNLLKKKLNWLLLFFALLKNTNTMMPVAQQPNHRKVILGTSLSALGLILGFTAWNSRLVKKLIKLQKLKNSVLITERLILKPIFPNQSESSDDELSSYLSAITETLDYGLKEEGFFSKQPSMNDLISQQQNIIKKFIETPTRSIDLIIFDKFASQKKHPEALGAISIKEIETGTANIAYWCKPSHRNKKIIQEAVTKALQYCYSVLGLKKLIIAAHKNNIASIKIAQKCNFSQDLYPTQKLLKHYKRSIDLLIFQQTAPTFTDKLQDFYKMIFRTFTETP